LNSRWPSASSISNSRSPSSRRRSKSCATSPRTRTSTSQDEITRLQAKSRQLTTSIFANLTPWQITQLARHPQRPYSLDYLGDDLHDFQELHGDRMYGDDLAIVGGLARLDGRPVMVIGHQKGRDTKERVRRNYGMPKPEGYRKALRLMRLAERFSLPIVTFIDTPGAYPGVGSEERNQSEAIARNLFEMAVLRVPIVSVVIGEGGSGGALAIGVCDRLLMLQYSTYSVISPEGCASILWKSADKKETAAERWASPPTVSPSSGWSTRCCASRSAARIAIPAVAAGDLATLAHGNALDLAALQVLPPARQRAVLRAWFATLVLPVPSSRTLGALLHDATAAAGDRIPETRWPGVVVHRYRGRLYAEPDAAVDCNEGTWATPTAASHAWTDNSHLELVPDEGRGIGRERLPASLVVMRRAGGERFVPGGGAQRRPLRKWLQEQDVLPWRHRRRRFLVGERHRRRLARAPSSRPAASRSRWSSSTPTSTSIRAR
jgi:acetyl-CoA carboxylase carboxyl transferase alpha subunit